MKKVLVGLGIVLVLSALGFTGFIWWKLQPREQRLPLPAGLVAHDTSAGSERLEGAEAAADYQPLVDAFEPQALVSYCGVATGAAVLSAMGHDVTQQTFFDDKTDPVRSRFQVTFGGMSLTDLAGLLEAHGAEVEVHYAGSSTVDEFRQVLEDNLSREGDYVVVNYQREALGQGRVGHISPLAAYDRDSDSVLVLDTAAHKYPPTWVPVESLFAAMDTIDTSTGHTRGFLEVGAPK
ncbi:MAG: phytochelatin synthase family protein [Myxococcota bacterium]